MNLLLRGMPSKEVSESVAADLIKAGKAESAHVDVPNGDLSAAQELIAGMWPTLKLLEENLRKLKSMKEADLLAIQKQVTADLEKARPLYERAMGDT